MVDKWLDKVDRLAERYHWDDDAILRLISGRLRGNARQWYEENVDYDSSWDEIKRSIKLS
ncbi:unnamed protein product [Acanthoscelides obtectus]|uniref:Retrotransposon gag domain-containing protein n=1 Tax=Acanthoscelides obtectus TaxID=200917 RepID=A0A9P0L853_ACAOB|nr:unnamed protein product [Acanthoscelides obtectus]CAK1661151.1 hypothetical protein AOBTE_LOCUS22477 [Acanthoscelides obtectus]